MNSDVVKNAYQLGGLAKPATSYKRKIVSKAVTLAITSHKALYSTPGVNNKKRVFPCI